MGLRSHKPVFEDARARSSLSLLVSSFSSVALSSPMYGLSFLTCEVINFLKGDDIEYAPGQTNYTEGLTNFVENELTNSETRFNRMINEEKNNPKIRLGGPSAHWVSFACEGMEQLYDELEKIEIPMLLFQGSNETIVKSAAHKDVIDKLIGLNKSVEAYTIDGAKHELLIEKDEMRNRVIRKILEFYEQH